MKIRNYMAWGVSEDFSKKVLKALEDLYNVHYFADTTKETTMVTTSVGEVWWISDNGGEYNIEKVNSPETFRSIAYTGASPETMAYRLNCVIEGQRIDWHLVVTL